MLLIPNGSQGMEMKNLVRNHTVYSMLIKNITIGLVEGQNIILYSISSVMKIEEQLNKIFSEYEFRLLMHNQKHIWVFINSKINTPHYFL